MFSVDNFYEFFYSEYGFKKTKNFILTFQPHGSKDFHNLAPYKDGPLTIPDFSNIYTINNRIIMHDQEPVSLSYLNTYKSTLLTEKNPTVIQSHWQLEKYKKLSVHASNIDDLLKFIKAGIGGGPAPIVCHSELYSKDIEILDKNNIITCYYWWHGVIARDWFRHWEHYTALYPYNKYSVKYRFLLYSRDHTGTRIYREELVNHCRMFQDQVLHAWHGDQVDSTFSAKINIDDAVDSAIHIVAETLFDTEKIYLTEKIFKPMVMSQPFILFGPPGSLQYLQNYGFKTFSDCWDESYDLEKDSTQRMAKLLALIDQHASMPLEEFKQLYEKTLPIIEHNRQRFFSAEFQNDLIHEMRNNMTVALLKQNQCHYHSLDHKSNANGNNV